MFKKLSYSVWILNYFSILHSFIKKGCYVQLIVNLGRYLEYGKDFMRLGFPPSYSNFPMYHRNFKLLSVRIMHTMLIDDDD